MPVFTIWEHEIHKVDGRWFAWWSHGGARDGNGELTARRKAQARSFIRLAAQNIGRRCRAVVVKPKLAENGQVSVEEAQYPHPMWAVVIFRITDSDAIQFVAELLPGE